VSLGFCVAFALSRLPLKDVYRTPVARAEAPDLYQYSLPVFVVTATVMGFYSLDVLLARAFFPDAVAGGYAVASFLGKSVLLGTAPVTKAMFPLSAEAAERRDGGSRRLLAGTLGILAACVTPVLIAFALVPGLLVRGMGGTSYQGAAELVLPLGVAMVLMAFSNALLLYRLSIGGLRFWGALPLLIPLEAAALALCRGSALELAWAVAAMNGVFLAVAAGLSGLSVVPGSPEPGG
jgi:O-antigen/teichoic acid export membrane protein